ncbi:MAG: hypothetical protein QW486_09175 [Candidatus Bathyarchaeia archaeon]|nr:hypothetical protein [Candidatus Bathyarchaeota archaeon]
MKKCVENRKSISTLINRVEPWGFNQDVLVKVDVSCYPSVRAAFCPRKKIC